MRKFEIDKVKSCQMLRWVYADLFLTSQTYADLTHLWFLLSGIRHAVLVRFPLLGQDVWHNLEKRFIWLQVSEVSVCGCCSKAGASWWKAMVEQSCSLQQLRSRDWEMPVSHNTPKGTPSDPPPSGRWSVHSSTTEYSTLMILSPVQESLNPLRCYSRPWKYYNTSIFTIYVKSLHMPYLYINIFTEDVKYMQQDQR